MTRIHSEKPSIAEHDAAARDRSSEPGASEAAEGPHHLTDLILRLQRTVGNQAVRRMLQTDVERPEAGLIGTASTLFGADLNRRPSGAGAIQTKLVINQPDAIAPKVSASAPQERAADAAASAIAARMPIGWIFSRTTVGLA